MASSTIKKSGLISVEDYNSTIAKGSLFVCGKTCLLALTIDSGNDGISQYANIVYQGIPLDYCPSYTVRGLLIANNANNYPIQVKSNGSIQTMEAIPSEIGGNCILTWSIA